MISNKCEIVICTIYEKMYIKHIAVICIFVSLQNYNYKYNYKLHICCVMLHDKIAHIIDKNINLYKMSIYNDLNIRNNTLKNNVNIVVIKKDQYFKFLYIIFV